MAKETASTSKKSPQELAYELSTILLTTEIWKSVIGSAPAKAALEEYCNSDAIVNLVGLVIGITLAETKRKDKTEEFVTRASINVMLPKDVRVLSESIRQSVELYHKTLKDTGDFDKATQTSLDKFLLTMVKFEMKDFVSFPVPKATSFLEGLSFSAAKKIATQFMVSPAMGALIAVYQSLTTGETGGLAKRIEEGFAKGVDSSSLNLTNFHGHFASLEAAEKDKIDETARFLDDARVVDTVAVSSIRVPDPSGLRLRKTRGIE